MSHKEVYNPSTKQKFTTAVKDATTDIAKIIKNSDRVTRRKFIYGAGLLAAETYFGLQIRDGIKELNKIALKLDNQNSQCPDQKVEGTRKQLEAVQEPQKLTSKSAEQRMPKDIVTRMQRADDLVQKNSANQQKFNELDKSLIKIVGNGLGSFVAAIGTPLAYIIHGVARDDL